MSCWGTSSWTVNVFLKHHELVKGYIHQNCCSFFFLHERFICVLGGQEPWGADV